MQKNYKIDEGEIFMYRWNEKDYKCPIEVTMDILGGKWRSLIFWHLGQKKLRFGELQKIVPGISKKVLTEHLKNLEKRGFIEREVFPEVPPRVEYSITSKGKKLLEVLKVMEKWGRDFLETEGEKI
jgi:DNA-binding HxlR family transcriptional regulator